MKKIFLAGLTSAIIAVGAVGTVAAQTTPNQGFVRPHTRSDANLRKVRRSLERDIDMMQHDQRDYGGHRVTAIRALQTARAEIAAAEAYDRTH